MFDITSIPDARTILGEQEWFECIDRGIGYVAVKVIEAWQSRDRDRLGALVATQEFIENYS